MSFAHRETPIPFPTQLLGSLRPMTHPSVMSEVCMELPSPHDFRTRDVLDVLTRGLQGGPGVPWCTRDLCKSQCQEYRHVPYPTSLSLVLRFLSLVCSHSVWVPTHSAQRVSLVPRTSEVIPGDPSGSSVRGKGPVPVVPGSDPTPEDSCPDTQEGVFVPELPCYGGLSQNPPRSDVSSYLERTNCWRESKGKGRPVSSSGNGSGCSGTLDP